jgi:hypothetical protein
MTPDITLRNLSAMQPLCIDRKIHDHPVQERQAAFVNRFSTGCNGALVSLQEARLYPVTHPWVIRGMKFTNAVQECWTSGRTLYYIDNGYLGNQSHKTFFRIIKNHVHDTRSVITRPRDRLDLCPHYLKDFTPGRKILIAPPSVKSLSLWNMDPEIWVAGVVEELKKYTDRPIEIRLKRPRADRLKEDTMDEALNSDVHCLVTYNSVAAVEAVMLGKPAIVLGPNAAHSVCSQNLSEIETPKIPTHDEREAWLRHLSYCQFTFQEMSDGTAWRILNEG